MASYDKGQLVRVSAEYRNEAGTLVDPTTPKFDFKNPAGTITTYTHPTNAQLVKDATGTYHVDLDANATGTWYYRFYGQGTNQAADEGSFEVVSAGGF
jgi:uncharacterized protein YfaS (alpha-2-macroglobulin family)